MKLVARSERSAADLLVALLRAERGSAPPPPAEAVAASDRRMLEQMAETHGVAPFLELLVRALRTLGHHDASILPKR